MYVADRRELGQAPRWQEVHARHVFDAHTWMERFKTVRLDERAILPEQPGVYVAVTYDDIAVYVGSTAVSLRSRFFRHHRQRAFESLGVDRVAYFTCGDPEGHGLYSVELRLIRELLPVLNDRSDNQIAVEFFDGRRRLVPLTEIPGAGWLTRWKVKPAAGRPRSRPTDRPS